MTTVQYEKLIIFGWIITIIPELEYSAATDKNKLLQLNKLVDKLYETFTTIHIKESIEKDKVYYAIKLKNGGYYARKTSSAPALFISENTVNAALKMHHPLHINEYEIVKFTELG